MGCGRSQTGGPTKKMTSVFGPVATGKHLVASPLPPLLATHPRVGCVNGAKHLQNKRKKNKSRK